MRDILLETIEDLVGSFLYYDRKEDEELPLGSIETAIKSGEVSVSDIVEAFKIELNKTLELSGE